MKQAAGSGEEVVVKDVLAIAECKLLGGISAAEVGLVKDGNVSLEAAMAVLSSTLSLSVVPQSYLASTLAGSHMSPVVDISEDRSSMVIVDAWDPVLSEAGKLVFAHAKFREAALRHLAKAYQDYLVDEGKHGELACWYILLKAMVECGEKVTVEAFLKQLLGEAITVEWDKDDGTMGQLLQDLKDYELNFNSFVPVNFVPDLFHLRQAYALKKAIICKTGDALLPARGPAGQDSVVAMQFNSSVLVKNYMVKASAGIGKFPLLLQVHLFRDVQGAGSIQKAFLEDGLESFEFLAVEERKLLKHLNTCRRLEGSTYFSHLSCLVQHELAPGQRAGKEPSKEAEEEVNEEI